MNDNFALNPEHLKLIHPFNCIISGPTQSGKTHFVFKLIDNLENITVPSINKVIYLYNEWQERFKSYRDKVFFTNDLKYLTIKPKQPTLIILDDFMNDIGNNKNLLDLFIKGTHHNSISAIIILQNIFHQGSIFKSLRQNCHYYYLTEHLQDRNSIEYFARALEPRNSAYFLESYADAVSKPYGGLFCDLHPHSKIRHFSKYRHGVEKIEGQTLYISKRK